MNRWNRFGSAIDPDLSIPPKRLEGQASDETLRSDRSEMQIGLRARCTLITHTACRGARLGQALNERGSRHDSPRLAEHPPFWLVLLAAGHDFDTQTRGRRRPSHQL